MRRSDGPDLPLGDGLLVIFRHPLTEKRPRSLRKRLPKCSIFPAFALVKTAPVDVGPVGAWPVRLTGTQLSSA